MAHNSFLSGDSWGVWFTESTSHDSSSLDCFSHLRQSWRKGRKLSSGMPKPCWDSYSAFYEPISYCWWWLKMTVYWNRSILTSANRWLILLSEWHLHFSLIFVDNTGPIVDPSVLVRVAFHFLVVLILIFVKFCLVDACLCIESVFIQVAFLIELLVNIGSLHKIILDECLLESTTNDCSTCVLTASSSACSFRCCHNPAIIVQIGVSWDKRRRLALIQLVVFKVRIRDSIFIIRGFVLICELLQWLLFTWIDDFCDVLRIVNLVRLLLDIFDVKYLVHSFFLDNLLLEIRNIIWNVVSGLWWRLVQLIDGAHLVEGFLIWANFVERVLRR